MEKFFSDIRRICLSKVFVLHLQRKPLKVTIMEKMKLISVRLDPRDVATLEEAAKSDGYLDRSEYIRAAVSLMAVLCKEGRHRKVLTFYPRRGDVIDTFDLTYHRAHR